MDQPQMVDSVRVVSLGTSAQPAMTTEDDKQKARHWVVTLDVMVPPFIGCAIRIRNLMLKKKLTFDCHGWLRF